MQRLKLTTKPDRCCGNDGRLSFKKSTDMLQFVELCEDHGTAYVCAALNFDTGTPIGRMVLQILAAFAEFERSMISTRVKSNMLDISKKHGRYLASPPFGYEFDEHKNLVIVPEEAEWIRRCEDACWSWIEL